MLIDIMLDWWKLAWAGGGIACHAPQVAGHRTARMLAAPGLTSRADRREASRMVSEKWDAGLASQLAAWQAGVKLQQQLASDFWRMALGWHLPGHGAAARRMGQRHARASLALAQRAIAPIHRLARSNVRRLSARR